MDDDFDVDFSQFELRPTPNQSSISSYYERNSPPHTPLDDNEWPPRMSGGKRNPLPIKWSPSPNGFPLPPSGIGRPPSPPPPSQGYRTEPLLPRRRSPSPVQNQRHPSDFISDRLTSVMLAPPDSPPKSRPIQNAPPHCNDPRQRYRSPSPVWARPEQRSEAQQRYTSPGHYTMGARGRSPSPRHYPSEPRQRSLSSRHYPSEPRRHSPSSRQYSMEPRLHSPSPRYHPRDPRRRSPSPRYHPRDPRQRSPSPRRRSPPPMESREHPYPPAYRSVARPPTPPKRHSPIPNNAPQNGFHNIENSVTSVKFGQHRHVSNSRHIGESSSEDATLPVRHQRRKPSPSKRRHPPDSYSQSPLSTDKRSDKPEERRRQHTKSLAPRPPPLPDQNIQGTRSHLSNRQNQKLHEDRGYNSEHFPSDRERAQSHHNQPARRTKTEEIRNFVPYDPRSPTTPMPDYENDPRCYFIPSPDY